MPLFDVLIASHAESLEQLEDLFMAVWLQKSSRWKLNRIILCSDNQKTAQAFSHRSSIQFLLQEPRMGKPDALNRMIEISDAPICIQNSADCIPASNRTYGYLLDPLFEKNVGAVSSRPVPYQPGFMLLPDLVWKCHHFVQPKLSAELFSFKRALVDELPCHVIHDDAYIHNRILEQGTRVIYEPRAIVFNSAPKTLREFYMQRKKNVIGNCQLPIEFNQNPPKMIRIRSLIMMSLELLANAHGRLDYLRGKIPKGLIGYNLESTKKVLE